MSRITLFLALQITSHTLIDYLLANSRERSWPTDDGEGQVSGALGLTSDNITSFLFDCGFSPEVRILLLI